MRTRESRPTAAAAGDSGEFCLAEEPDAAGRLAAVRSVPNVCRHVQHDARSTLIIGTERLLVGETLGRR